LKLNSIFFKTIVFITACLAVFEYFRAYNIGMTCDESYSFTRYVDHPYLDIIFYHNIIILPNNHVLNTIGMKFFSSLFGCHAFVLRLTNLIAFTCYCLFFLHWLRKRCEAVSFFAFFALLFLNPYLLDFFILARGYGLGTCLMMMSLFAADLLRTKTNIRTADYFLPLTLAMLSVWANFAFLNFYLGFIASIEVLIIYQYFRLQRNFKQLMFPQIPVFVVSTLLLLLIYQPMHKIIAAHQLYGGMDGFWHDTVQSLILSSFYETHYPQWVLFLTNSFIAASVFLSLIIIIYSATKGMAILKDELFHAVCCLLIPALANTAEHWLFNTEFPEDRTGVYYIPLYAFFLIMLLRRLPFKINMAVSYLLTVLVAINFFLNTSMRYVVEWKYDTNTGKMMNDLKQLLPDCNKTGQKVFLGCNPLFEPTISYYRRYLKLDCIEELDKDGMVAGVKYNYLYVLMNDGRVDNLSVKRIIKKYEGSESKLVELN
jgi:hypothetical protein